MVIVQFYKDRDHTEPFFTKHFKGSWDAYCAYSMRMRSIYRSAFIVSDKVTGL